MANYCQIEGTFVINFDNENQQEEFTAWARQNTTQPIEFQGTRWSFENRDFRKVRQWLSEHGVGYKA